MALDPVAVALKFGFLIVLYLFLIWMARSALKDLRRGSAEAAAPAYEDATGMHHATAGLNDSAAGTPKLRVGERRRPARRVGLRSLRGRPARARRLGRHPASRTRSRRPPTRGSWRRAT